jgi:cleavage and polyadenylation specificity factor subunit 1
MKLEDTFTGRNYLVDSGAEICVFPASDADKKFNNDGENLLAANGSAIRTYGSRNLALQFGNSRFTQDFVLADVQQPILGANFFARNHLLIDLAGARITRFEDWSHIPAAYSEQDEKERGLHEIRRNVYETLLAKFPELLVHTIRPKEEVKHKAEHHIDTSGPPLHARARRLDGEKLAAAKEEFRLLEEDGVVRRSDSPWASPLHCVPKKDGSWRPCGDYRRLNTATTDDRYPLPHIQSFNEHLCGKRVFSSLDLRKGYYQIPVRGEDVPKTAVITPFGLFEFLRMPFGLKKRRPSFSKTDGHSAARYRLCLYLPG